MTIDQWLKAAVKVLTQSNVPTARLDALILLEDVTGRDRAWLLANPEYEISVQKQAKLDKLLKRRTAHEPLAYIRGKTEFYGRQFVLNKTVLEPRPESEAMIDLLIEVVKNEYSGVKSISIADVGTGSGALGITARLEVPNSQVELLEIDSKALKVAKTNVDLFTLKVKSYLSDLLSTTVEPYDILLCNLPYVPDDFQINIAASHEPRLAIFGGPDGLDLYRRLIEQISQRTSKPLYILSESLPTQHRQLAEIASQADYKLVKTRDFIQLFQYIK